jgi:uncharacterized membrane protein YbhN (UPF0104 family)
VVVAFAALGVAHVDVRAVAATLARSRPGPVALAMAANVANLAFHAARWAAVVRPPGVRVRLADVFEAMVGGFAVGIAVPARAGDLVRSHLLARRAGLSTAAVIGAAAVDYVVGTASLVPLILLLGVATPLPGWARHALVLTSIGSAAGVAALLALRPSREAAERPGLLWRLRSGLGAVHEPLALTRSFAWGFAGWGAELLVAWFTLDAVGIPPTLVLASLVVVATAAANAVAVSPGNAGPFELAAVLPLAGLGVAREPALAFALLLHVAHLAPTAVLGGWVLLREARREPRDGAAV